VKIIGCAALAAALALAAVQAGAQDIEQGRALYETHCGACHYQRVHQRTQKAVRSLAELRDMVARWAPQTRHRFSLDDIESVVQHLNRAYYGFGEK
jgi:cytochrome c2